jgi:hypothetical protein
MLQAATIEEGGGGGPYDNKREFVFWNPEIEGQQLNMNMHLERHNLPFPTPISKKKKLFFPIQIRCLASSSAFSSFLFLLFINMDIRASLFTSTNFTDSEINDHVNFQ